jgi:precorrin-6x reductase
VKKIALFGGTAQGRELALALQRAGMEVWVSVATGLGRDLQEEAAGSAIRVRTGRMDAGEMEKFLREGHFFAAVDATHPYAWEVSQNLRTACQGTNLPCYRLGREETPLPGCLLAEDTAKAARLCRELPGNILLATGAKELPVFCREPGLLERLYPRILPVPESLEACRREGVPPRRIIAMMGPFSHRLNLALMEQFAISVLVTKDGGEAGGMPEKLSAAREHGAKVVVIRRPLETGRVYTREEILGILSKEE